MEWSKLKAWIPRHWPEYLILALLAYTPIFHNLDRLPLRIWDETRQAFNAWEMSQNGHWLALYFEGAPDLWNVKTPLMVILQALGIKVFGWTELAIRLPSALAALATVLLLFHWLRKYLVQPWFALGGVALLLSFKGYVDFHAIRTGDMDALLTFFIVAFSYCIFEWTEEGRNKHLIWFFVFLLLAYFTKSIAALLPLPAIAVFLLLRRKLLVLLKTRLFWLCSLSLLLIPLYHWWREYSTPGYWEGFLRYELGGRFLAEQAPDRPVFYYLHQHLTRDVGYYLISLLPGMAFVLTAADNRKFHLGIFVSLLYFGHQLVLAGSKTKNGWYDVPELPFLAMLFVLAMDSAFYDTTLRRMGFSGRVKETYFGVLIVAALIMPQYLERAVEIGNGQEIENGNTFYEFPAYLKRKAEREPRSLDGLVMPQEGYHWYLTYYVRRIQMAGGTLEARHMDEIKPGDRILLGSEYIREELAKRYFLKRLHVEKSVEVFEVREGRGWEW